MSIAEVKAQHDIIDVAKKLGIEVDSKTGKALCPFHNDKNPSLQFSREKQIATCFSGNCTAGTMDVITLVEKYLKVNNVEALKWLNPITNTIKTPSLLQKLEQGSRNAYSRSKQAQAYEFIVKQKDKFDTVVEDRGLSLSGGERQRLTIARAFACNADILVFDEGLSAIDEKIKYNILEQLKKLKKEGKIIVIISHQIKTLEIADNIYTIENCKLKTTNLVL